MYSCGGGDVFRVLGTVPRTTNHHELRRRQRLDADADRIPARTLLRLRYYEQLLFSAER